MRNHLETILESLTTGVVVTDLQGRVTMMNGCAARITERSLALRIERLPIFSGAEEIDRAAPAMPLPLLQGKRKIRLGTASSRS